MTGQAAFAFYLSVGGAKYKIDQRCACPIATTVLNESKGKKEFPLSLYLDSHKIDLSKCHPVYVHDDPACIQGAPCP